MNSETLTTTSMTLGAAAQSAVVGQVTYDSATKSVRFAPTSALSANTLYTATLTTGVQDLSRNALATNHVWTFTTGDELANGPAPVNLGSAGNHVVLAKNGISTTGTTSIVGAMAVSPAAETATTGFSLVRHASDEYSTSAMVDGNIYAAKLAVPSPSVLTTAISDMETAYTDAAGRSLPDFTELGAGDVSGMTLSPGLYKWGTGLLMTSDVTLNGDANAAWIFQIADNLTISNGVSLTLIGGPLPENVFWLVAGSVTLGTTGSFSDVIMSQTLIDLQTGSTLNGRALAQTAMTVDATAVN